jgi:Flp pilus assembly protein TadG
MPRLIRKVKKQLARMERGQVLLIVTLAIVGIVAIVGLSLDVGVMFIENARLRRAVDSAALAAALQYREGYTPEELEASAEEFLRLNGIIVDVASTTIQICDEAHPAYHSADLCTVPPRKLVRVSAVATAHLAFLPVIGIDNATMSNTATSETASVDVVLLIDTSDSMTYDFPSGDPMRDPSVCNDDTAASAYVDTVDSMPGECHPFEEVKTAARSFVQQLYYPFDRVAIVTFDKNPRVNLHFSSDESEILSTLAGLTVYEGEGTCPSGSPCRWYNTDGSYRGFNCQAWSWPGVGVDPDMAPCGSTNLGGGLMLAGNEFAVPPVRTSALWVVILLSDGAANQGYCPPEYFGLNCRDTIAADRHMFGNSLYDADDYARDMADFVGQSGQNALLFTIGLGPLVTEVKASDGDGLPDAEGFLQYAVEDGVGNGLYYAAPTGAELRDIFQAIADNIATRLSH